MENKKKFLATDIVYLSLLALGPLFAIALKVLFTPQADDINIAGALIFFTVKLPFSDLPVTETQVNSLVVIWSIFWLCKYITHGISVRGGLKRQIIAEWIVEKTKSSNIHKYTKDGKIRIACAYALDNTYVFPTLVAMTSLAENASSKTFYDIYVMIGTGFKEENKKILLSVEEKHKEHCKIYFIDMADKFKNADTNQKITTPTYYRLELPSLLPEVNRVIWMDGDTAVFEDLTELITIDMKNNYIMGFLDSLPDAIERFGIKDATVLCAGVLLFDLDALRKNHMQEKMHKFIADNLGKLNQHDQTVINVVCQNHIGPLPPKYGIWSFEAQVYALKHNERQRPWLKYDTQEFINAYHHPAILHYVWPKPFWRRQRPIFNDEWWKYAKISGYYNDVYNKSPKWISNRLLTEITYERNHFYFI